MCVRSQIEEFQEGRSGPRRVRISNIDFNVNEQQLRTVFQVRAENPTLGRYVCYKFQTAVGLSNEQFQTVLGSRKKQAKGGYLGCFFIAGVFQTLTVRFGVLLNFSPHLSIFFSFAIPTFRSIQAAGPVVSVELKKNRGGVSTGRA